jgi:glycosyltransferase involved in cell wall biosynthesis
MNHPHFSIIIPTLNEEKSIPHLLKDLENQTFKDFEVIVSDGESEDNTIKQALSFSNKLKIKTTTTKIRHVSVQRNNGGHKAQGKYIIFMDADNRLPKYFLEGVYYRILSSKPDVFTTWCKEDKNTKADKSIATLLNLVIETTFIAKNPGALGALIGTTPEVFKELKGFNEKIAFCEDADYVNRAHKLNFSCQIFHDPKFIYSLRRFRKNGRIAMLQKYAALHLKRILNLEINYDKEYPMGGKIFQADYSQNSYQKINLAIKTLINKPQIAKKIRHLLQVILDQDKLS